MVATKITDDKPKRRPSSAGERTAVSYLVRFWMEPTGSADVMSFRGYARDLKTGEERYYGDPRRFGEQVLRRMQGQRRVDPRQEQGVDPKESSGTVRRSTV